jgi:hypothetical protein
MKMQSHNQAWADGLAGNGRLSCGGQRWKAFYASLSDEQKATLDSNYGRCRFGRWHDRR